MKWIKLVALCSLAAWCAWLAFEALKMGAADVVTALGRS